MKHLFKKIIVAILTAEARLLLRRKNPTIIAITGSVGKTTTKDAIYAAIKDSVPARKSQKSYNSEIGVPLTILGLSNGWSNPIVWLWNILDGAFIALFSRQYPAVLVLETGVDTPGDMERLAKWLQPDVAVLTRLPDIPVHVEHFSSPEAVVAEKMKLVTHLKDNGVVIYNHDDTTIQAQLPHIRQKVIGFSRYVPTGVTAGKPQVFFEDGIPAGVRTTITAGEKSSEITMRGVLGSGQVYSVVAAVAVARHVGVPLDAAISALSQLTPTPGRMRLVPGLKGTIILDDTYNSSPIAVENALHTIEGLQYSGRNIVVLGDMLELGKYSAAEHERIGADVAPLADALFTVGVRARGFAAGALTAGLDESVIFQFETAYRAGRELQSYIQPGDLVLIKGSQSIRMERIVKEIMHEPRDAEALLVRQDKTWLRTA